MADVTSSQKRLGGGSGGDATTSAVYSSDGYVTVTETVMRPVTRTVYRDEQVTAYRTVEVPVEKTVTVTRYVRCDY